MIENNEINNNVIEYKPTNKEKENDFNININRAKSSYKNEINLNNFNLINQSKSIKNEHTTNSGIKNPMKRSKIRMFKINSDFTQRQIHGNSFKLHQNTSINKIIDKTKLNSKNIKKKK